jgi:hypothetical protein
MAGDFSIPPEWEPVVTRILLLDLRLLSGSLTGSYQWALTGYSQRLPHGVPDEAVVVAQLSRLFLSRGRPAVPLESRWTFRADTRAQRRSANATARALGWSLCTTSPEEACAWLAQRPVHT